MRSLTAVLTAALVLLPATPAMANPVNQPPVAVDDVANFRNIALPGQVRALDNDSDAEGDPLVFTAVSAATKGQPYIYTNGLLYYQPYQFETGTDSFTYTVSDGQGNTATGTVTITLWSDLPAPGGLVLNSADTSSATITWPAAANAVAYQVFRNTVLVGTTSKLTWTDTGLLPDRQYGYRIASVNGGGFGGQKSDAVVYRQTQQWTPVGLAVDTTDDPTSLSLTWLSGETGPWNVYRDGALVASSPTRSFTDTGLVTGQEYSYQVQTRGYSSATSVAPPSALTAAVKATPVVLTDIGRLFRQLGSSAGALGPVTVAERAIDGGRQQDHENGLILQQDGETPLAVTNPLAAAYVVSGGPAGYLGFPVAVQESGLKDGGSGQLFEGGSIWKTGTGPTHVVPWLIEDGWAAVGWEDGLLGWPTSGLIGLDSGYAQEFEYGAVYWSEGTGSHAVAGPLLERHGAAGGLGGPLGYPTGDIICGLRGDGCAQRFQGGWIHWSPATGAHVTTGTIFAAWARQGGQNGKLGYPAAEAVCGLKSGGCGQRFQGGWIHWSPATGAHATTGTFLATWARLGAQNGRLGYPTGSATAAGSAARQTFQGGSIAVDLRSGRVSVTYR